MKKLPDEFLSKMKSMLKEEYVNFLESYNENPYIGIRINELKCDFEKIKDKFNIKKTAFCKEGYYIIDDNVKLGANPLHHAGAFYVQEPSASAAVSVLNPLKGEKILDLCAAPGGKSTQIASMLKGTGLLWSNEIVKSRAQILLSNIERMGIRNAVISSCCPEFLCSKLNGFFDKVLVDAPCSGEGMFRKDTEAIKYWSREHVNMCAVRQLAILNNAAKAVKSGGIIVYSTCTFSPEENECVIEKFLLENPEFSLESINVSFGRSAFSSYGLNDGSKALRIFPMDGGEGHFIAKLRCNTDNKPTVKKYNYKSMENIKDACELFKNIFSIKLYGNIEKLQNTYFILPNNLPDISGMGVIRAGVKLGEQKGSRIEPSHALFMSASFNELNNCINFDYDSSEIYSFLKGKEIETDFCKKGYVGVSVDYIVTGFGKYSDGRLKNKYPKGLRNN